MQIYSHPLFLAEGNNFPGKETPRRLEDLEEHVLSSERAFNRGDEEDPELLERITSVHSYLDDLRVIGPQVETIDEEEETHTDRLSYRTAIAAVATSILAAEMEAFALVRPPGHHAHKDKAHGFCLLNNMAIAALYCAEQGKKVLVLDVDVHHGCGTEEILAGEECAKMISLYKRELWPGKKDFTYAKNCTHLAMGGAMNNKRFLKIIQERVMPEIYAWKPDIIGVSLGLDTFADEQFGWELDEHAITTLRETLKPYRIFGILEGGYISESIYRGVQAFTKD
ncbi:hypothetical protein HZA98_02480 [Candidatus Woesearchaeota archaeon]|nr:hypothetical protein [Candidatus Woesearchaeota archaeon]